MSHTRKLTLVRLRLRNFGRFDDISIDLMPFTVLIGPNDSGKSTVLAALKCFCCVAPLSLENVRRDSDSASGRSSEVRIEGTLDGVALDTRESLGLDKEDMLSLAITWNVDGFAQGEVGPGKPRYEIMKRMAKDHGLRTWPKGKEPQMQLLESLGISPERNEEGRKRQWEERRKEALANGGQSMLDWSDDGKETFLRYLPRIESISASDISNPESLLVSLLAVKARSLLYPEDTKGGKHRIPRLREVEEEVGASLNHDLEQLVPIVAKHLSGLSRIHVAPEWDFVRGADFTDITLERNGAAYPLGELGAGSSSRCALAMLEWSTRVSDPGHTNMRLRTMDEPDHRLHFDAQRKLISILRKDIEDDKGPLAQCIVATHSLTMLDCVSLDQVIYLPEVLPDERRLSPLVTRNELGARKLLGDIQSGLGLPPSWVFLEKAIIVVEGATEREYIQELYHIVNDGRTLAEDGVRVWDALSCGNVINAVLRLVEGGRAAVFVALDSDAKTRRVSGGDITDIADKKLNETFAGMDHQPRIVWLGKKELEDEWTARDMAKVAQAHWPRDDGRSWQDYDFSEVAVSEKPSEQILSIIRKGTRSNLPSCQKVTKENVARMIARMPGARHPEKLLEMLLAVSKSCSE